VHLINAQKEDGAKGLDKCCGYGTVFQSRFEAPFLRAVHATISNILLPTVLDKDRIAFYLQAMSINVFTEFENVYRTGVENQEDLVNKTNTYHVAFAARQGSPAVSYRLRLMNTEGVPIVLTKKNSSYSS
jgi:hypothetical protein